MGFRHHYFWEKAVEIYKDLFLKIYDNDITSPETCQILMGISCCFCEVGADENAIKIGQSAVEMNRYFPGVYKYIALSQKASDDCDAAFSTMTHAVSNETPWEDANKIEVKNLYDELKSLDTDNGSNEENTDTACLDGIFLDLMAQSNGYEKLDTSSSTKSMASDRRNDIRLNFWPTTVTIGCYLDHPIQGKSQLFRREVDTVEVEAVFHNPRVHIGKGYQHVGML